MNIFLIIFGGVAFVLCVYALFAILTTKRDNLLQMIDGNILTYISLITWMIVIIAGAAFLTLKGYDSDAATNLRQYVHSFTLTYFFEGALCLLMTYGVSKMPNLQSGLKRTLIIAGGILLGLLSIFLGLQKIFGD